MRTYTIPILVLFFISIPSILPGGVLYPKGWKVIPESKGDDHIRFLITGIQIEDRRITSDGKDYTILYIPGGTHNWDPGFPQLPIITESCFIPPGRTVEATILDMKSIEYPSGPIMPCPPHFNSKKDSTDGGEGGFPLIEDQVYSDNSYYPSSEIEFSPTGVMRGLQTGIVRFYPAHYNPVLGRLKIITEIRILIRFQEDGAALSKDTGRIPPNGHFKPLIESFINPELARTPKPVSGGL